MEALQLQGAGVHPELSPSADIHIQSPFLGLGGVIAGWNVTLMFKPVSAGRSLVWLSIHVLSLISTSRAKASSASFMTLFRISSMAAAAGSKGMISPRLACHQESDRPEPAGICLTIPLGPYWLTGLPPLLQMLHVERLDSRKHSPAEGSSQSPSAGRCFLGRHYRRLWQMPRKQPK